MRMSFKTVVIGAIIVFVAVVTAVVFIPAIVLQPQQTIVAEQRTGDAAAGRVLYYSNGCNYCHTQYVREQDTAMGRVSEAGDYVYDSPMALGSERTGPDLSYIGRKRSMGWEIDHLKNPREFSPMSIMPQWSFLTDTELHNLAAYLWELGDRTAAEHLIRPPEPYQYVTDTVLAEVPMVNPPSDTETPGWDYWTQSGLKEGKEIFSGRCLVCHGDSGNGLGTYAGTLTVTPVNFKAEPFNNMPEDEFFWHISEGVQGTVMPPWKESLTEEERWKVTRYVIAIYARPTMHNPMEGDPPAPYADQTNPLELSLDVLDRGKMIFIRECYVCHGDNGRGDGPYRAVIQPGPPDFGVLSNYTDYKDADYFWRISEGVPWTAMPAWKEVYHDESDRWALVHYIRAIFTQTEEKPAAPAPGEDFNFPEFYKTSMRYPATVSASRGQSIYLTTCATCHGTSGIGDGANGAYLNPTPMDFRKLITETIESEAQPFAQVTFGVKDTAMPSWGEFLRIDQRWDVVKYVMDYFIKGAPVNESQYGSGMIPITYAQVSSDMFTSEGHIISPTHGVDIYNAYCLECHGTNGAGNGPGTVLTASGAPAAFPQGMNEQYIFWRIWEGVPDSVMYAFKWIFSSEDAWDVTTYIESFNSLKSGK
ncbi:MAG: c-type cytochrome [Anaerolineae bacterium]